MAYQFTGESYVELLSGTEYDPRGGASVIRSWHGSSTALASLDTTYRAAGRKTSMEPQSDGSYILRVRFGAEDSQSPEEPLSTIWELVGNDLEKNLWTLPVVKAAMATITDAHDRATIRKYAEAVARGEYATTGSDGAELPLSLSVVLSLANTAGMTDSNDQATLSSVIDNLTEGVESWTVSQYVLRRTVTLAANAGDALKPAYTYVGKVMTKAQVESIEGVPNTLKFNLPDSDPAGNPCYLKRTPTVTQVAADKWQVVSEWWHADDYSDLIYDPA
jgi:hypothetical protein